MDDVRVHEDVSTLLGDAASYFLTRLEAAQDAGRLPYVSLTGGSLVPLFHAEVVRRSHDSSVDFTRVEWWWGDERYVGLDDADRNDLDALTTLLAPLGVPAHRIHRVPGPDTSASVEEAAEAYAHEVRHSAGHEWEVVVLGMGPDGHVASLFPHHPATSVTDAIAVAVHDSPKPPPERVSLTFEAFERSRAVMYLVAGAEKAEALARAQTPGPVVDCPARAVRGQEETVWFVDSAAASSLA
ncbi:MAG: 6-phosphogluconolactonase [Nocardioides sp.]|uniref:6-phosphogluconolactonase n=1 Tax=Nocardioides sp. TaxID=35761 RepID=UPI003F11C478